MGLENRCNFEVVYMTGCNESDSNAGLKVEVMINMCRFLEIMGCTSLINIALWYTT